MKRKLYILIGIIFVAGLFAATIFVAQKVGKKFKSADANDLPSEYTLSAEHSVLISPGYTDKIEVKEVRRSKVRNPFSQVIVDRQYDLIIYKIDLSEDKKLSNVITARQGWVDESAGPVYKVLQIAGIRYKVDAAGAGQVNHVFLGLDGDSLKVSWLNDDCVLYYLVCDRVSIKYKKNGSNDIYVEGSTIGPAKTRQMPLNIMFLRKAKSLYCMLMVRRFPNNAMPSDLLSKVIAWK